MTNDKGYNYAFVTFERSESAKKALANSEGWSVKSALRSNNYPNSKNPKRYTLLSASCYFIIIANCFILKPFTEYRDNHALAHSQTII